MSREPAPRLHQSDPPAVALAIDPAVLRPLIEQIVAVAVERLEAARGAVPERLAFGEAEAARLLGLHVHQLRDERLRGRIAASRIVGNRIAYRREDLTAYLMERRVG